MNFAATHPLMSAALVTVAVCLVVVALVVIGVFVFFEICDRKAGVENEKHEAEWRERKARRDAEKAEATGLPPIEWASSFIPVPEVLEMPAFDSMEEAQIAIERAKPSHVEKPKTIEQQLPDLPDWCKMDNLGGLVPSEVRQEMKRYAREAVLDVMQRNMQTSRHRV